MYKLKQFLSGQGDMLLVSDQKPQIGDQVLECQPKGTPEICFIQNEYVIAPDIQKVIAASSERIVKSIPLIRIEQLSLNANCELGMFLHSKFPNGRTAADQRTINTFRNLLTAGWNEHAKTYMFNEVDMKNIAQAAFVIKSNNDNIIEDFDKWFDNKIKSFNKKSNTEDNYQVILEMIGGDCECQFNDFECVYPKCEKIKIDEEGYVNILSIKQIKNDTTLLTAK